jgi:hypothetical protein
VALIFSTPLLTIRDRVSFNARVLQQSESSSTEARISNPDALNPWSNPPAPEKKLITGTDWDTLRDDMMATLAVSTSFRAVVDGKYD